MKWILKSPQITEWSVLQAAANAFLKDGMIKQAEQWDQLRIVARRRRIESDVKHWDQYTTSNEIQRNKRRNKKSLQIAKEIAE